MITKQKIDRLRELFNDGCVCKISEWVTSDTVQAEMDAERKEGNDIISEIARTVLK